MIKMAFSIHNFQALPGYTLQDFIIFCIALSNVIPKEKCSQQIVISLANYIQSFQSLKGFSSQHLANIANAIVKVIPNEGVSKQLMTKIVMHLEQSQLLKDINNYQELIPLAHGMTKIIPEAKASAELMKQIATHLMSLAFIGISNASETAVLIHSIAKLIPETSIGQQLIAKIGTYIEKPQIFEHYTVQELSYLIHMMAKVIPLADISKQLFAKMTKRVQGQLKNYPFETLSYLTSAAAKILPSSRIVVADEKTSHEIMAEIASCILQLSSFSEYKIEQFAGMANNFAKALPGSRFSQSLIMKIVIHVQSQSLEKCSLRTISNLTLSVARVLPKSEIRQKFMCKIATHLHSQSFSSNEIQNLLNLAYAIALLECLDKSVFQVLDSVISKLKINELSLEQIMQIYQFYLFANAKGLLAISKIHLQPYEDALNRLSPPQTVSSLEKQVLEIVQGLFKSQAEVQVIGNYPAVGNAIDIAIIFKTQPALKIAIEVDGPFHYRQEGSAQVLNNSSCFKNLLLEAEGWKVLRLPHFEIAKEVTSKTLQQYLANRIHPLVGNNTTGNVSTNTIEQRKLQPA